MNEIEAKRRRLFEMFVSHKIGVGEYTTEEAFNNLERGFIEMARKEFNKRIQEYEDIEPCCHGILKKDIKKILEELK